MRTKPAFMLLILLMLLCLPLTIVTAQDKQGFLDKWRQTLKYGIDQEIIEVLQRLKALKENGLDKELQDVLAKSVSTDVRKGILDFFTGQKYTPAEDIACTLLKNHENEDPDLVRALLVYLGAIKSRKANPTVLSLITNDNDSIAQQAIMTLGQIGDRASEDILLAKLADKEFPESRKSQIITALGDVGSDKSVDALLKIVENTGADKIWRMYACEALGKIGDARAVPVIKKVFAQADPLLKAYAAGAMAHFNLSDVIDILIQGLKDNFWKVRIASAKALARPDAAKAVPILKYKAYNDPENVVRREAVRTLGAIGTGEAFHILRQLFEDEGQINEIRQAALDTLIKHDLSPATIASIKKVIISADRRNNHRVLDFIGRTLGTAESGGLRPIFIVFMESSYSVLRIYGIRGVVHNKLYDLKGRIEDLSEKDPNSSVKKEADSALGQF